MILRRLNLYLVSAAGLLPPQAGYKLAPTERGAIVDGR
jgi:hypothetical protein